MIAESVRSPCGFVPRLHDELTLSVIMNAWWPVTVAGCARRALPLPHRLLSVCELAHRGDRCGRDKQARLDRCAGEVMITVLVP